MFRDTGDLNSPRSKVQIGQRSLNAVVSPSRIFIGKPEDELRYVISDWRPSRLILSTVAVIPFRSNEPPVLAENRVGSDNGRQFHQRFPAKRLALYR